MAPRRQYLGACSGLGVRERVFALADAVEVDEYAVGEIERRRVFYDDILALTLHRYRGTGFLLFTGFAGFVFLLIAFGLVSERESAPMVVMLCFAALFFAAFLGRLILGVDMIVVYGRRSSARLRFGFRKARARRVFEELRRRIAAVQDAAAAARAAEEPPPPPPEPIGPPPAELPPPLGGSP